MGLRAASTMAVLLLAGACGGGAPSATPPPTSTATAAPSATPTATASPTPSPTPAPVDVSAPFVAIISDPAFSADSTISGTMTISGVEGTVTGGYSASGDDSTSSLTISIAGQIQTNESIEIGDKGWARQAPGPWLVEPPSTKPGLADFLESMTSAVDLGVVDFDGTALHHIQPSGGNELSPEAAGFDVEGATDAAFTIDFYATDDGTPAAIVLSGSWTQVSDGQEVEVGVEVAYALTPFTGPIEPPTDIWQIHTSKAFDYRMAYPGDWAVKSTKAQDAYSVDGQDYVYVVPQDIPNDMELAAFVKEIRKSYKPDFGDPILDEPSRLGGRDAYRLVYRFTNADGLEVTVADYVTVFKGKGYEVFIATGGGDEDVVFFETFVATFEFTD